MRGVDRCGRPRGEKSDRRERENKKRKEVSITLGTLRTIVWARTIGVGGVIFCYCLVRMLEMCFWLESGVGVPFPLNGVYYFRAWSSSAVEFGVKNGFDFVPGFSVYHIRRWRGWPFLVFGHRFDPRSEIFRVENSFRLPTVR